VCLFYLHCFESDLFQTYLFSTFHVTAACSLGTQYMSLLFSNHWKLQDVLLFQCKWTSEKCNVESVVYFIKLLVQLGSSIILNKKVRLCSVGTQRFRHSYVSRGLFCLREHLNGAKIMIEWKKLVILNGFPCWLQVQLFPIFLHNISIYFPVPNAIVKSSVKFCSILAAWNCLESCLCN
jgi:hypothetical protein